MEIFNIVVLSISGLMLFTLAGLLRLINPIKNYWKNSEIKIENEVNMLSEVRGMSTLMLLGGIVILLGTIIPELTLTSFIVAILLFGGYVQISEPVYTCFRKSLNTSNRKSLLSYL